MIRARDLAKSKFPTILENFLIDVECLKNSIEVVMPIVGRNANTTQKKFNAYIQEKKIKKVKSKNNLYFLINNKISDDFDKLHHNLHIAAEAYNIISRSFLVSLISQFDTFLASLLKEVFTLKPEMLNSQEKKVSYSKIYESSNIQEVKQYILDTETESWFGEGYRKILDNFEEKHNLTIKSHVPDYDVFTEAIARRNLFTHNNGIVNERYLTFLKTSGVDIGKITKGQLLNVSPEYFYHVLQAFSLISVIICNQLWRKFVPEEDELTDGDLSERIVDFIDNGQLKLALNISNYSVRLEKYFSEETRLILLINNALCYKRLGQSEKVKTIIESVDWTPTNYLLKMCVEILKNNYKEAISLMEKIGSKSDLLDKDCYRKWPIFNELKKNKDFMNMFRKIFKEDFYPPQRRVKIQD
jgi:hypothetical protein